MGHTLVDKAVADVAAGRGLGRLCAADFGFLPLAFVAVGQQIIGISGTHYAGTGQG